ncbi:MAG: restriction endonuclease subunit S [Firmicutes bacterium]|nr:restriction endonuclease subunit S [Bacillota bacterium]
MKEQFLNVFKDVTKYGTKIPKENYLMKGKYPIFDQGQEYIAGYTNEENGIYSDVPIILFGDHTRIIKYIDVPCFLGADGVKLLKAKKENANYKYLYYALCHAHIPNTGYNRHFKWLKEINIIFPSNEEQQKIAAVLDKVSELIALRKKQLEKLDELVKSRFVKMFGDPVYNSQNFPTTEFVNVVTLQRGYDLPVYNRNSGGVIPIYGANGILDYHSEAKSRNGVITGRSGTIGKVYYCEGFFWPLNTTLFSIDNHGNNVIYLAYLLQYFNLKRFYDGTGVPTLNRNIIHKKQIINIPIELQEQFANFVTKIDKQKLTIQQSLDKLEVLKKALMQQYFG